MTQMQVTGWVVDTFLSIYITYLLEVYIVLLLIYLWSNY
jgi:hypothetical protein